MTGTDWCRAFIGLGGNLGDPLRCFRDVLRRLSRHQDIQVTAVSSLYRTEPVGGPPGQPDYLNAVVALRTLLLPRELLDLCRSLEHDAGRRRGQHWGPRTLDLDLLLMEHHICSTPLLELPHPRLHQRHFVLQPLHDLAPMLIHPLFNKSIAELLEELPGGPGVVRIRTDWLSDD